MVSKLLDQFSMIMIKDGLISLSIKKAMWNIFSNDTNKTVHGEQYDPNIFLEPR